MAILKCKMCGGDISLTEDKTIGICDFCGNTVTFPRIEDEQKAALYNRGNHFRQQGDFDKALAIYEQIIREDDSDAEAHWCCVLSRFGIEYVEDPTTLEWIPTCHRASFDSILDDVDYLAAIKYSDGVTRKQYQKDALKISEVQKGILQTSQKEEPFDIFICYKESDENGNRTLDSSLAQEIYYQLTDAGYKVFFSRITLEDKAGTEYEPYIFAALNSAKVMVVVGTSKDNLNAVWVKNEWSRFLALMRKDRKRTMLPCYRDMDPYDMPEALSILQSYDMGKIGFIQDLLRGIHKILDKENELYTPSGHNDSQANIDSESIRAVIESAVTHNKNLSMLLKRGFQALEDEQWKKANSIFEEVLNEDIECADAYLGEFLAENECASLEQYKTYIVDRISSYSIEKLPACKINHEAINNYVKKYEIPGYLSKKEIEDKCNYNLEYGVHTSGAQRQKEFLLNQVKSDKLYQRYLQYSNEDEKRKSDSFLLEVEKLLDNKIAQISDNEKQEKNRIIDSYNSFIVNINSELEKLYNKALEKKKTDKKKKNIIYLGVCFAVVLALVFGLYKLYLYPELQYKQAISLAKNNQYEQAIQILDDLNRYKDSDFQKGEFRRAEAKYRLINSQIGDIVEFGHYSEGNNWIVIDKTNSSLLLLSKEIISNREFNNENILTSWERSELREWLNHNYYNEAFDSDDQRMIELTNVLNADNDIFLSKSGNDTEDYIFLLSKGEVETLTSDVDMELKNMDGTETWWWLRTSGKNQQYAVIVNTEGKILPQGFSITLENGGVRPALWVNIAE